MIVSDVLMPGMDGFQFCRVCKKDDRLMKIPFVFYTATYTSKEDEEFALNLGAEKFLTKPLEPNELLDVLKSVLEDHRNVSPLTPKVFIEDEKIYLAEYNKRLVRKLEKKVLDLEKEMDQRKKMEKAVLQSEKLKLLGTISAGVSHDYSNILTIISGKIQLLEGNDIDQEELADALRIIKNAVDDGAEISRRMLKFTITEKNTTGFMLHEISN